MALNDTPDTVRTFMEDGGYDLPVLLDNGQIAGAYGVSVVPTTFFIDSEGRVGNSKVGVSTLGDLQALVASVE